MALDIIITAINIIIIIHRYHHHPHFHQYCIKGINQFCHILMFELQRGVLSTKSDMRSIEIPLLVGLASQTDVLTNMLLSAEGS
ncbi:hypothetical protein ElyMa_007050300, partial [Elysia marginata]